MVAVADFVVSATLVAVTVSVPAIEGATYAPVDEMVPSSAAHVTAVFATVPCTVAENCSVPLVVTEAEEGESVTEFTTGGAGGEGGAGTLIVMLAEADLVVSATLVAVTVAAPAVAGAV
jgi:hypothetical protein